MRENDIDFQSNELGCQLGEAFAASLRPAIFDREIAAVDPAEIAHSLHEGGGPLALRRRAARSEQSDGRHLRLLRVRRERPRNRNRAAECSQQFPPSNGGCHTPLPREVRKRNDTTPQARSLHGEWFPSLS